MLRILLAAVPVVFSFMVSSEAHAACGPNALGTHRTVTLNPSRVSSVNGRSGGLGLRNKEIVLTFDDGPMAKTTGRILKTLSAHCAKATFFSVGRMARAYPATARKIVRQGHTLAHHTHSHENLPKYSSKEIQKRIDKGIRSVQKSVYNVGESSARVPFFRYPYLARSSRTDGILRKKGLIAFGANIDSLDWKKDSPTTIVNRVMKGLKREKKGVILMHDIHMRTVKALPILLKRLKSEGYRLVHVVPSRGGTKTVAFSNDKPSISTKKSAPKKSLKARISDNRAKALARKRKAAAKRKASIAKARERFEKSREKFKKKWGLDKTKKQRFSEAPLDDAQIDQNLITASLEEHDHGHAHEHKDYNAPKVELRTTVETNGFVEIAGSKESDASKIDFNHTASTKTTNTRLRAKSVNGIVCVSGCS